MELELTSPEVLIAKGIKAEDLFAFCDQVGGLAGSRLHRGRAKQDKEEEKASRINQCFVIHFPV